MLKQNKFIGLFFVSAMLIVGFMSLYSARKDMFAEVEKSYADGLACNINSSTKAPQLASVLFARGYFDDVQDANFVAAWLVAKAQTNAIPNLGTLNKTEFRVPVDTAMALGGTETRERAQQAIAAQGFDFEVEALYAQLPQARTDTFENGQHLIEVQVLRPDSAGFVQTALRKLLRRPAGLPVEGVAVCLTKHSLTMSADRFGNEIHGEASDSVMGYGVTDADGVARFLVPGGYYSVRPIRRGYTYGQPKGTTKGILDSDARYTFTERPLTITPLSSQTYQRAKQDMCLTVRTPAQYKDSLIISVIAFLMVWWAVLLLMTWLDSRRAAQTKGQPAAVAALVSPFDHITYTILMALTAICLLAMFGTAQPLTDMDNGGNMAGGIVMGVLVMFAFSQLNLVRFYNGQSRVQIWFLDKVLSLRGKTVPALSFLLFALILMALLYVFGNGPEGSDARVNLWGFQPSEVNKFLIVTMIAAFFAQRATVIQAFSKTKDFILQGRQLIVIALCMLILLGGYGVLSDMGPALVVLTTFILLYSVARQDTAQLFIGTISFLATLYIANWLNPTAATAVAFALLWLVAWVAGCLFLRHQLYESAIMMALVITAFILGGDILSAMGQEAIGQRLANRSAMAWSGIWQNDIVGGDQVAQGIWGLATGGLTGQGLGQGCPSYIPAYNTDMILAGIGEMLGWIAIALIVVCLAVLLHRTLLLARRAGHPFVFFLLTGIAIVTGIQFFVITMGSLGLIPLTGVAVPFLSFGKASLIVNLAAFGLVLAGSRQRATANQRTAIRPYDNVVATSAALFIGLGILVLGVMLYYQGLSRNDYLVRPAFVANADGIAFAEYNPRIHRLERKLLAGNIYDRNGLLLATSGPADIVSSQRQLAEAGLDHARLNALARRKQRRYYPFGMNTVFAVGDINDGLIRDENALYPKGYGAEYRHLTALRGFDNLQRDSTGAAKMDSMRSRRYRPSRFLPEVPETFKFPVRDYSDPRIVAMLRAGENSPLVKIWNDNRHTRDLCLTIDARLQTLMQQQMEIQLQPLTVAAGTGARRKMRASVVVLNASTGDLLCSANYPLPTRQSITSMQSYSASERNRDTDTYTPQDLGTTFLSQPGSTAKVITEMAAFRKLGPEAANLTYNVRANEQIHERVTGPVSMRDGLVRSINAFNVHLAHQQELYPQYAFIDYLFGMRLHLGLPGERRSPYTPYYFYANEQICDSTDYSSEMSYLSHAAMPLYQQLFERNQRINGGAWTRMPQFGIAWGQHNIMATPLTMARVAATVANDGLFVPTRYTLDEPVGTAVRVMDTVSAHRLQEYMRAETNKHRTNHPEYNFPAAMGGKTGTPERVMHVGNTIVIKNDAWYICFVQSHTEDAPLAIALRIERSVANSGLAVRFINGFVLPALRDCGYRID